MATAASPPIIGSASTLPSFLEAIAKLPELVDGFYAFRGVRNIAWRDAPGIMRSGREKLLQRERDAVRDLIAVHPQEFDLDSSMFDRLVRMQHYGLPTRLLDVTANPLVALHFATESPDPAKSKEVDADGQVIVISIPNERKKYFDSDTISCIANLANLSEKEKTNILNSKSKSKTDFNKLPAVDRLVQFIRAEKPSFRAIIDRDELDRMWYVVPKMSNRRIIAQRGAFMIYGSDRLQGARSGSVPISFRRLSIPQGGKDPIRKSLETLGINRSALFPEIDHAAEYIIDRYS